MNKRLLKYKGLVKRVENDENKREEAIKANIPVRFEIERDMEQLKKLNIIDDIWSLDILGKKAVLEHDDKIQKYAKKHNIDPDITRSVMYAENAKGHKIIGNKLGDVTRTSDSPLPMNIQKDRWSSLIDKEPDDLYDADNNVEAATILLRRISDRIDKPDAAKIGSIWNFTGREKTNEFGEYIGQIYEKKPWKIID